MNKTLLLFFCLLSSCTSTTYQSTNLINVFAGSQENHTVKKRLKGENKFYLWGLFPKDQLVNIDEKALQKGLVEFSVSAIEEFQTIKQYIYSLFTFGMYIPVSYKINGRGLKSAR